MTEEKFCLAEDMTDMVNRNFKMEFVHQKTYKDNGEAKVSENTDSQVLPWMVTAVGFNDLYDACEAEMVSVADDYKLESKATPGTPSKSESSKAIGEDVDMSECTTRAEMNDYFKNSPTVLCMQLNRLKYDMESKELKKIRHKFEIEKELALDRFMIHNQTKIQSIREKVSKKRDQIRHLEDSIKQFVDFGGSGYDMRKMFFLFEEFFLQDEGSNLDKQEMTEKGQVTAEWKESHQSSGVKSFHPFFEQIKDKKEASGIANQLKKYHQQLTS
mmetsp:Transcript_25425/g.39210  ORF Transcript_25425/g.39210 Transcript_25425/m.39210 type:complete len:272 (-) Transcript_25425:1679-2494(-)